MNAARKLEWITPHEYLAMEQHATLRHEYVDGLIYAMAGGTQRHNIICLNLVRATGRSPRLGKPCEVFASDMRVQIPSRNLYYYPDLVVSCRSEPEARWLSSPCLVVEVVSPSTAAIDHREKRAHYLTMPSLQSYVLVEQDRAEITVFRRDGAGWTEQILGADDELLLDCLELAVPVAEVYARVTFGPD